MSRKKKELTIEEYKEELDNEWDLKEADENTLPDIEDDYEKSYKKTRKKNKASIIINIIFITLIIIMTLTTIDIICVGKYNKGPFFAIKTATYKDGGTKVYYGFGYKVIKYNQLRGRKDIELGTWNLEYNPDPIELSSLDLAIEFTNKPQKSYTKFYKKFLKITGEFIGQDDKNNTLTLAYVDEDGKYNLDIICKISKEEKLEENVKKQLTIVGTMDNYKEKTSTNNRTIYINNCFIEE